MRVQLIEVIRSNNNWYKVGDIYAVRSDKAYSGLGLQVFMGNLNEVQPDVVMDGDYKFITG